MPAFCDFYLAPLSITPNPENPPMNTTPQPATPNPIRVGIAGLGRSGWNIHARALGEMPDLFQVVAVSDLDEARRGEAVARFGCRAYTAFESLIGDDGVDLVVVATPNHLHVEHTIAAAGAGRHVVCEKPFASCTEEVERVKAVDEKTDRVIAPFQNARFEAMFRRLCEVIASGVLGRIVEIRLGAHSFSRRWDWQTLREFGGGILRNTGPHFLDQMLVLFGDTQPEIFCRMDRALWSGDAEDHAKVIMHGPGAPLIDLELSSACAYAPPKWLVMGSSGGMQSDGQTLNWRYVDFSTMPPRPVDRQPTAGRTYNRDELNWQEETWTVPAPPTDGHDPAVRLFYQDISRAIQTASPLTVTIESVARQIAVIEQCHAQSGFGSSHE